eukprot:2004068-Rhodomonas_salina.3
MSQPRADPRYLATRKVFCCTRSDDRKRPSTSIATYTNPFQSGLEIPRVVVSVPGRVSGARRQIAYRLCAISMLGQYQALRSTGVGRCHTLYQYRA